MKRTTFALPLLALLPLVSSAGPVEDEAEAVVSSYLEALQQGNTLAIETLLGGQLLEKRLRLLGNPSYPDHLRETYGSSTFSVDRVEPVGEGIVVEATITSAQGEVTHRQFLLQSVSAPDQSGAALRIHAETEP